jgi:hypothetical protein
VGRLKEPSKRCKFVDKGWQEGIKKQVSNGNRVSYPDEGIDYTNEGNGRKIDVRKFRLVLVSESKRKRLKHTLNKRGGGGQRGR